MARIIAILLLGNILGCSPMEMLHKSNRIIVERGVQGQEEGCKKKMDLFGYLRGACLDQALDIINNNDPQIGQLDSDGNSPLHYAAILDHIEIVEKLVAHEKTAINATNKVGLTALMLAAQKGKDRNIEVMLGHNDIEINLSSLTEGRSALMYASYGAHLKALEVLFTRGDLKVLDTDKQGMHVFFMPMQNEGMSANDLLATLGKIYELYDNDGSRNTQKLLNAKDLKSKTPLSYAKERDIPEVIQYLEGIGAQ